MTSSISWELYRTFLGVLEHGSLSAAARALVQFLLSPAVQREIEPIALGLLAGADPHDHVEHLQDDEGGDRVVDQDVEDALDLDPQLGG